MPETTSIGPFAIRSTVAGRGPVREHVAERAPDGRIVDLQVVARARGGPLESPGAPERFVEVAQRLSRLSHPHIQPFLGAGRSEDAVWLCRDRLPEEASELRPGARSPAAAAALLDPVAEALDHAHARGVVHGDLHARLLRVLASGPVILTGFDATWALRWMTPGARLSLGSRGIVAPEEMRREPVGPAADVFGLAAIAFESLAGRPLFEATSLQARLLELHTAADRVRASGLPQRVLVALARGAAADPVDRWPSCGALVEAIAEAR